MIKTAFLYRTSWTKVILRRSHELLSDERGVGGSGKYDQGAECRYISIWETCSGTRVVVDLKCLASLEGRPEAKQAQRHSPAVQAWAQRPSSVSEHLNGAPAIFSNHPPERGRPRADMGDGKILALASTGMSTRMIAAELGVSQPTVVRRLKGVGVSFDCPFGNLGPAEVDRFTVSLGW